MKFSNAGYVENVVWFMKLADLPRGANRAKIDRLANGLPPFGERDRETREGRTNVNFLEFPELCADARRSYYNAFLKPGQFFNVSLDSGPVHKRDEWAKIITLELKRPMKRSKSYFELLRSQYAQTVLHGIGPAFWPDGNRWCPSAIGIEDILIPSETLLSMENLEYFALFRQWTPMELYKMTHGPNVDPGWNMPLVKSALDWADSQLQKQLPYNDWLNPEKIEMRWKEDLGFYGTDAVPTVDAWEFYYWSDQGDKSGWRRKIILDTPSTFEVGDRASTKRRMSESMPKENKIGKEHGQWLYDPGEERVYAEKLDQIIHFQFGDASSVAPFRYHAVRSLGWLLYAVCHLQNRLRCKVNDAVFESLLQYFRVSNPDDKERITKIDLHDLGVVPEGVSFVTQAERWQLNQAVIELVLTQNMDRMQKAATQYREGREMDTDKKEKTATEIMAKVNSANALVGALLIQAYQYAGFQYNEVARRFCIHNSRDADVRDFRARCLKKGIPEDMLDSDRWNIEPERVLGSGNKTLEIAMADKLMAIRPQLDPESQRLVDHIYCMANTDNPDMANRLVPMEGRTLSSSAHEADVALGTLLAGLPVRPKHGENNVEFIESWLSGLAKAIQIIQTSGQPPTPEKILGLQNLAMHIGIRIQLLGQDKNEKAQAKEFMQGLTQLMKQVQQLSQMPAQAPGGNGGLDPKDAAKIAATQATAQSKIQIGQQAADQKRRQRGEAFAMQQAQDKERHAMEMRKQAQKTVQDSAAKDIVTASEIRRGRLKALREE